MYNSKIELNNIVNTEIIQLDFNQIKNNIDYKLKQKCREIFHKPGIVIVDNIFEEKILKDLQNSLSPKERKFKEKFLDESYIDNKVLCAKLLAEERISEITNNLFGFNTPYKEFGLRNMKCGEEPMHFDSYFSKCGITPFMSIANIDIKDRLWNVGYGFEELLIKKNAELKKLFKKDKRNISASIKLREDKYSNLDKNIFHKISFAPNSLWFSNPKILCHQLVYGGGILINSWDLNELSCKCQDCLLRKYGFDKTANQALNYKKLNPIKKILKRFF